MAIHLRVNMYPESNRTHCVAVDPGTAVSTVLYMYDWAKEHFGDTYDQDGVSVVGKWWWAPHSLDFSFSNLEDATFFYMTWCTT